MVNIYKALPPRLSEVDIIVAGGGTAACVVAARLADADPDLVILVIEAGPNNYNEPTVVHPALFFGHFSPDSPMNKLHVGKATEATNNQPVPVICGRVLGGGSSINTMMYARGQKSDYDDWNMPGWTAEEFIPYLNKFETYFGAGDAADHGSQGPIHVSEGTFRCNKATNDLMSVITAAGYPETNDLQSVKPNAVNGVQRSLRYVSQDGKRQDAAHCYLHPRLEDNQHPNLHVLIETEVCRVIVENGIAAGVECRVNPELQQNASTDEFKILARKLVVVSSGAFGSPAILERSGIGNTTVLDAAGVAINQDLPGVGNSYQDHQFLNYAYHTSFAPNETIDGAVFGYMDHAELIKTNSPMLGHNCQDVGTKLRPTMQEVESLGSEFQQVWKNDFEEKHDKPLILTSFITCFPGYDETREQPGQYMGHSVITACPSSTGYTHITGPSITDPVDFHAGFLSDEHSIDLKTQIWGYKKQREFMRRMQGFRGEFAAWHPPFPSDSAAACIRTDGPLPASTPDIHYTAEDDAIIESFVRAKIGTLWHSMGTCKMAPKKDQGVVDQYLAVYGVDKLKVADLSIVPHNVAANTASTALGIGEKAADIIIHELGLNLKLE